MYTVAQVTQLITPLLRKHNVIRAALFGSLVKGTLRPDSDIDVLVEVPETYSLFDVLRIRVELEESLKKKVDLVQYKTIKAFARDSILSSQVSIFS